MTARLAILKILLKNLNKYLGNIFIQIAKGKKKGKKKRHWEWRGLCYMFQDYVEKVSVS